MATICELSCKPVTTLSDVELTTVFLISSFLEYIKEWPDCAKIEHSKILNHVNLFVARIPIPNEKELLNYNAKLQENILDTDIYKELWEINKWLGQETSVIIDGKIMETIKFTCP